MSFPGPPEIWSCPEPPYSRSFPAPPDITSSPSPPEMTSSPPPPEMLSCPPRPRMQSFPVVPTRTSLFDVPTIIFEPVGQQDVLFPKIAVTICVARATFPAPSRAVHVTSVVPSGNLPGALLVILTPHESVAFARPRLTLVQEEITRSAGTNVNLGGIRSGPTVAP